MHILSKMPDHVEPVKAEWSTNDLNVIWSKNKQTNQKKKEEEKKSAGLRRRWPASAWVQNVSF